jgi:hypothetical protein
MAKYDDGRYRMAPQRSHLVWGSIQIDKPISKHGILPRLAKFISGIDKKMRKEMKKKGS